jgi:hypothetical protein
MPKHIQGKDGKFAGSIGDGKRRVPTAAPKPPQTCNRCNQRTTNWTVHHFNGGSVQFVCSTCSSLTPDEITQGMTTAHDRLRRNRAKDKPEIIAPTHNPLEFANNATRALTTLHPSGYAGTPGFYDVAGVAWNSNNGLHEFAYGTKLSGLGDYTNLGLDTLLVEGTVTENPDQPGHYHVTMETHISGNFRPLAVYESNDLADANLWLKRVGTTMSRELTSFTDTYTGTQNRTTIDQQRRTRIAALATEGRYIETQEPGTPGFLETNLLSLAGTGRNAVIRHRKTPNGFQHIVEVKDTTLGLDGQNNLYGIRFTSLPDAKAFAQEMLLAGLTE